MELMICIIGAISAIIISFIGAWLANKNSIILESRKLKELHYVGFIEALHNLATNDTNKEFIQRYTFARDKMFIIASENVITRLLAFEKNLITDKNKHDYYLTELIKEIRRDLKLKDKNFPQIHLKKA